MRGTLLELLHQTRRRHPGRIALDDPHTGAVLTYEQLGIQADRIRGELKAAGVRRGDRVGLCAPKSATCVAAIHGILGCGAAYIPVDAGSPASRNASIFADCGAVALILARPLVEPLLAAMGHQDLRVAADLGDDLVLVGPAGSPGSDDGQVVPDDVAYILYTSGSTGMPKGVVHTHSSARAFVDWCSETFAPTADDRFSSHAPFHFDLSILDLYVSLAAGAAVVVIDDATGKQPLRLAPLIEERRITIWYSTPSALRLLAGYGKLDKHDHSSLRLVLFAGEVFPVAALRALKNHWPRPRYFNLYGPTETNVCTYYPIPDELDAARTSPYPIGGACAGNRARVVDLDDNDVAFGTEGELLISGPTVMKEYWNLPARTASAFLTDGPERWYRTGDIVRETVQDGFVFHGRRDRMVKRRGFRVELGEIEAALGRHQSIEDCAVMAMPDDESGVRIEAALVSNVGKKPSLVELKQYCASVLPLYMVPDRFTFRDSIPQTSTGKTDYQRLREELN